MPATTRNMAKRNNKKAGDNRVSKVKVEDSSEPSAAQSAEVDTLATRGCDFKVPPPTSAGPTARLPADAGCATTSNVSHPVEADSANDDESEKSSSASAPSDLSVAKECSVLQTDARTALCQLWSSFKGAYRMVFLRPHPVEANIAADSVAQESSNSAAQSNVSVANERPVLSSWAIVAAVALLMVVVAAFFGTCCSPKAANVRSLSENRDLKFQLGRQFPGQARRFYSTVAAAVQAVQTVTLQPQPAALLFVSSNSTVRHSEVIAVAECLAHLLERNLTGRRNAAVIEGVVHGDFQPDESKLLIDQKLEAHFSSNSRVALVTDIEKLSLNAAKIFYKYCDHENSPYKNVVFVLTITVGDELAESHVDSAIEAALLKSWSPHPDEVAPILTRVTNHLLVLTPLPRFMCKFDD